MKLLLTSGGLMNKSIISALSNLVARPFSELNVAFIPTASNLEPGDKFWLIEDLIALKNLKLETLDIVDISALPQSIWQKRLEESHVIFVEGGNTFHLNYWVHESGLAKILPELLEKRVYVGVSAGTIIATPSLGLSTAEKKPVEEIGETIRMEGLGFVDFLIEPHINNKHFPENTFENLEEHSKKTPYTLYALDDNSAVVVNSADISIVSEGEWKKFG